MKKYLLFLFLVIILLGFCGCTKKISEDDFVFVKGGTFVNTKTSFSGDDISISDFYIGKYEITQKEWIEVMGANPSQFKGEKLPVETISWYDSIEYCNKRSIKEGLKPYYTIDKDVIDPNNFSEYDDIRWTVTINEGANGYRLPTEAEWEYAASGGQKSKNYTYSGSDDADEVGWYWRNSGDEYLSGDWTWPAVEGNKNRTNEIGGLIPNELGIYDMSGNVREWCWEWYSEEDASSGSQRIWKGGGWMGDVSCCEPLYRGKFEANGFGADHGFRVCRGK